MTNQDFDGVVSYDGDIYTYRVDECGRYWVICVGDSHETLAEGPLRQAIEADVEHQLRKRGATG